VGEVGEDYVDAVVGEVNWRRGGRGEREGGREGGGSGEEAGEGEFARDRKSSGDAEGGSTGMNRSRWHGLHIVAINSRTGKLKDKLYSQGDKRTGAGKGGVP